MGGTGEGSEATERGPEVTGQWQEVRQVGLLLLLASVMLFGQIQNEVLFSVDGIAYALVGKELAARPLSQWAVLTWGHRPFYEHPHLTPWLLGASIKLLGASTLAALMPAVLLSTASVLVAYLLGAELLDHRSGILTGTVLALTPQFVKNGRNPMLEPALMLFTMLVVYFHLRRARHGRWRDTWLAGACLGLALLAKGPPALLALGVIAGFELAAWWSPRSFERFPLSPAAFWPHLGAIVLAGAGAVILVDLWHLALTGQSFVGHYLSSIGYHSPSWNRGPETSDPTFYLAIFLRYWPWLPLVLAAGPWVVARRDRVALPALTVGGLVVLGTFVGFTLWPYKGSWYVNIHYIGSSLMAALVLRALVPEAAFARHYRRFCAIVIVSTLFLSASLPALFLSHPRPLETFMEGARVQLGSRLEGQAVADCVGLDPWRGPLFFAYYLGATRVGCEDPRARVQLVDHRERAMGDPYRVLFARQPFSLVERGGG